MHAARALPPAHVLAPPAHTSLRIVCPPFDWAGRVGVQPVAQLRHVQRHGHGLHVLRALRACPSPLSLHSRALIPCMLLVRCRRPTSSRPRPTPRPASHALLSTRQVASAFNQPLSFDTSSVATMYRMFLVRSAHTSAPQPSQPGPLPVHAARALPPAYAQRLPCFRLGRTRWHSISRSTSTRPASWTWTACSPCAPRMP